MTDTAVEPLIPEGKRITSLTVAELDYASKRLGMNVITALSTNEQGEPHQRQAYALAVVALCWARRRNPAAKLEEFTNLELGELTERLGVRKSTPEEELNIDPTDPSPSPSD
jgi:hypothetical protein